MSELKPKRTYRSLIDIPVKVEMAPVEHHKDHVLSVDELQEQIEEARKGKAKVDSKYVGFELGEAGHLHDYKYDYVQFLDSMQHIIKEAKSRPRENRYKNKHKLIIQ